MNLNQKINQNGWSLCKQVFEPAEVESIRAFALKTKNHSGDILSNPHLNKVLIDKRVVSLAKEALASETVQYFGDSTVSIDSKQNGFHKDSRDRYKKESAEWHDPHYSLIRIGIYLQDHSQHSGGLCLRDNSHLTQSLHNGKILNVKSEVGDVIIWKLTTTHSGNADVLKHFPSVALHPRIARRIPNLFLQQKVRPRIALFATYGLDDEYLAKYIDYLKTRSYMVNMWKSSIHSPILVREAKEIGVNVWNVKEILESVNEEETNVGFKQL